MGFAEEMTNLGENFAQSFDDRINFLGHNSFEVRKMKRNAHNFLGELKRDRKAMSRKLHHDLRTFTTHLSDTVDGALNKFRKQRHHLHLEFKNGHNAFQKIAKAMFSKRHNFFTNIKKAEQKFAKKKGR